MAAAPVGNLFLDIQSVKIPRTDRGSHRTAHTAGKLRISDFRFESGDVLPYVDVAFETWGELNTARDNAVVVCHALTGNSHCGPGGNTPGWWEGLIGPGKTFDTDFKFVIASNVLGGCFGSTGPMSLAEDKRPYALRFPLLTIRDMVRAQVAVLDAFQVQEVDTVIGGSLGGMQAWEWGFLAPERVRHVIAIAAHAAFSPLAMGYNEAMRQAIVSDPGWHQGEYYGSGMTPLAGMMTARSIGMLTYRTDELFWQRFGRGNAVRGGLDPDGDLPVTALQAFTTPQFAVESYLHHQGRKLAKTFDANTYLYLTRAMDGHDVGRGRGGLDAALSGFVPQLTVIGIDSDYLYGVNDLKGSVRLARAGGVDAEYLEMSSVYGHDAFLMEQEQVASLVQSIKERV